DMYRWLRGYWPQAALMSSLRQKAVEQALGLSNKRTDEIGGGECISLYNRYLMSDDEEAKRLILLHNADDVAQLGKIFTGVKALPFDRIAFELGFCFKTDDLGLIRVLETRLDRNNVFVKANKEPGGIPSVIFEDCFELEYEPLKGDISLKIALSSYEGRRFVDLTRLPVDASAFKELSGYHSDFLVLADEKEVKYREINELTRLMLSGKGLY
ncbi:MAG: ribonuclease H-like domain-containing protein, partial [Firmicutes bacterium]|nr:ribonuclease H-like domain-containing protein [Bacillota bacterium]